ncbi:MAG TPA: hypothetical protein VKO45_09405, partial [Methanomicrobiales archaeon]|nr:hypothetical protein [Methanomicrobiales archaeon]
MSKRRPIIDSAVYPFSLFLRNNSSVSDLSEILETDTSYLYMVVKGTRKYGNKIADRVNEYANEIGITIDWNLAETYDGDFFKKYNVSNSNESSNGISREEFEEFKAEMNECFVGIRKELDELKSQKSKPTVFNSQPKQE